MYKTEALFKHSQMQGCDNVVLAISQLCGLFTE